MPPSFLPIRLKRETPFKSQLGCTFAITLVLVGMAAFAWLAGKSPADNSWVAYVVSAGFGFFGLLILWSLIRQMAAVRIRESIVELSAEPLQPGQSAKACLIQPGPAKLKSLRANLVCIETRLTTGWNSQTKRTEARRQEKMLSTENLIEATHLNVAAGDAWHEIREFSLPSDAPIAATTGEITISWKVEVWGTGYFLASFMHPFPVDVYHGQRPVEEDDDDEDDSDSENAPAGDRPAV